MNAITFGSGTINKCVSSKSSITKRWHGRLVQMQQVLLRCRIAHFTSTPLFAVGMLAWRNVQQTRGTLLSSHRKQSYLATTNKFVFGKPNLTECWSQSGGAYPFGMHGVLRNSRLLRLITRPTTTTSPPTMQLRSRVRLSSTLEVSVATETAVLKRQSPKTTSSLKEKEVRNGRNATRKRPATTMSTGDDVVQKAKSPKKRTIGRNKDGTPEHWQTVMEGIQEMRAAQVADVDVAGIEVFYDEEAYPPHIARFRVLISAMLSSQTKDPVNAAAMKRLTTHGLTVQSMLEVDEAELAQIIRPVGFFNNKAKYIKQVAQILKDRAGEDNEVIDIPNTYDDLVALPGVGPKMAHLIMSCAWKTTVGICVDTHVHRISNRLGWVKTWNTKNPKSQDPEKTRLELEDWLPREHWNPINVLLVGFGQTICLPRGPKCDECKVAHLCPSAHSSAI